MEQGELITKQAANYLEAMELDGWTDNELEAFKADLLDPFLKLIRSRPMKTIKPTCWHCSQPWIVGSKLFATSSQVPRRWMRWIRIPAPRWSALIVPRAGSDWRHNCSRAPAGW